MRCLQSLPLVAWIRPESVADPVVGVNVGGAGVQVTHDQNVLGLKPVVERSKVGS